MLFWSFGSEVETRPEIDRAIELGKTIALPRIVDREIQPRSWRPGEPLDATAFGAMEPADGRTLDPSEIDVVVTPGVAFDLDGYRIGYGAGFYDRFFTRLGRRVKKVAVGFEIQVVPDGVPRGSFDLPVDALVTEDRVVRFGSEVVSPRRT
jgi:5-formyltetrahydrofolate cyclo-ligase